MKDKDLDYNIIMSRIIFHNNNVGALEYLEKKGIVISKQGYYDHLKKLDEKSSSNLYKIAQEFPTIVDNELIVLNDIQSKLYQCYENESDQAKRASIAFKIAELQPYITSLYSEIRNMIETNAIKKTHTILRESKNGTTESIV